MKPGQEDDIPVAELAKPLLGQELIMRYAQRIQSPAKQESKTDAATSDSRLH